MPNVFSNPYGNCTAKDPANCRYHGKQFKNVSSGKLTFNQFFQLSDKAVPPSRVLHNEKLKADTHIDTYEKFADGLTDYEKASIYAYCDEYGSHKIITRLVNPNANLQQVPFDPPNEEYDRRIAALDSVLAKGAPVDKPLYRGVKKLHWERPLAEYGIGDTVSVPTFMSSSIELDTAKDFVDKNAPILLIIKTNHKVAPIRGNFNEHEYLLPRDLKLRITKLEENVEIENNKKTSLGYTIIHLSDV
jgi:hypothetical protein